MESLISGRDSIPLQTPAEKFRWKRVLDGAKVWPLLFPPIIVVLGKRGWPIADVEFNSGDSF